MATTTHRMLTKAIARHGLRDYEATLRRLARPTLLLRVTPVKASRVGASRLGGTPDLPPRFAWPVDDAGKLLGFLAQIDLAGLPEVGLPVRRHGML